MHGYESQIREKGDNSGELDERPIRDFSMNSKYKNVLRQYDQLQMEFQLKQKENQYLQIQLKQKEVESNKIMYENDRMFQEISSMKNSQVFSASGTVTQKE